MRTLLQLVLVSLFLAASASAQITNGDFNAGMTGWTISTTGPVTVYMYPPLGLPNNSALIGAGGGIGSKVGSGSITQAFYCGFEAGEGTCVVEFDYFLNTSSVVVVVEAIIDGVTAYNVVYPTEPTGWTHVVLNTECGLHTLTLKGQCTSSGAFAVWDLYVDNVTGNCEEPVPTAPSTWGKVKALYR